MHTVPTLLVPPRVKIVEVGPRDGLQNEPVSVSTEDKIKLVQKLAQAGCRYIEAGSFVSPKWVPSMANSFQTMTKLREWKEKQGPEYEPLVLSCLVPNLAGLHQAIQVKAGEIAVFGSASETFSNKNINCSIDESLERFALVVAEANTARIPVRAYLSCVIGCPYQGRIPPLAVAQMAEKLLALGCHELSLGDTIGVGTPTTTIALLKELQHVLGNDVDKLAVHFHDTHGQALANILVSLESGIATVDASVAGLGGCPYAPGASGNVATEDVVYMLNGLGVETGIDLDKLVEAGDFICEVLDRPSRSRAGTAISAIQKRKAP
ncbi:hydroxymethylglutaryl-coenzyme A lyase [Phaeodactylum tricornutum CCAP 1055/1]|jgi:hydroxymethylglutaryl-CoA lyase|uniref:hydroxymethylglutaryl-CoA lyase n=1 Tax=Phaeodactylum tricornutum (strain CCAP 1055/1) TaxID=556484 RepID=B7G2V2_PHATC|nr:hydroxymethylglutaryl-coenzyme A lyase [Phaeodactylum tricornutum CCAP 1055/1]EEC47192.1 hydroxymethylglutaryl-coenzyme A lyase [Phaeodactylum tricornutum CCAP 1055/1]|eukprot:XP_002181269.1 hydroxymethylglutaryl-coenzyme A lyase [Phaeodactylum tricornutum CCAP 1055/1]